MLDAVPGRGAVETTTTFKTLDTALLFPTRLGADLATGLREDLSGATFVLFTEIRAYPPLPGRLPGSEEETFFSSLRGQRVPTTLRRLHLEYTGATRTAPKTLEVLATDL